MATTIGDDKRGYRNCEVCSSQLAYYGREVKCSTCGTPVKPDHPMQKELDDGWKEYERKEKEKEKQREEFRKRSMEDPQIKALGEMSNPLLKTNELLLQLSREVNGLKMTISNQQRDIEALKAELATLKKAPAKKAG
jgi:rRNA maturation protein Nop10